LHENEYENRTGKNLSSFPENRIKIEDPDTKEQLYNYRCNIVQGKKLHWIRNGFCSKKMKIYMLCLSLIFDVERH
jgi:hypothetical protein